MKRLVQSIILFFNYQSKKSEFNVRKDEECGGYIASSTDPLVRATGETKDEAIKNLKSDIAEIERMRGESQSQATDVNRTKHLARA
jgi:hypothetical protein